MGRGATKWEKYESKTIYPPRQGSVKLPPPPPPRSKWLKPFAPPLGMAKLFLTPPPFVGVKLQDLHPPPMPPSLFVAPRPPPPPPWQSQAPAANQNVFSCRLLGISNQLTFLAVCAALYIDVIIHNSLLWYG